MAAAPASIFTEKATNKLRNPDDLDKIVRVTNPSALVVFAACIALVAGLLSWGVFGTVASNVGTTGAVVDGEALCFLSTSDREQIVQGSAATVDGKPMTVAEVAAVPLSRNEASGVLHNDYLSSTLVQEDWEYLVTFEGDVSDLAKDVPLAVNITTERIAPIELLFNK